MLDDQRKVKKINLSIIFYIIAKYLHNIYRAIFITLTLVEKLIRIQNTAFLFLSVEIINQCLVQLKCCALCVGCFMLYKTKNT